MSKKLKSRTSVSGLNVLAGFLGCFCLTVQVFPADLRTADNCSVFKPLCRDYTQINEQAKARLSSAAPSPLPSLHLLCMHMHSSAPYSPVCVWVSEWRTKKLIKLWFTGLKRSRLVQLSLHYDLFPSLELAAILLQPIREIRDIERSTEPIWAAEISRRFQQQFNSKIGSEPSFNMPCSYFNSV